MAKYQVTAVGKKEDKGDGKFLIKYRAIDMETNVQVPHMLQIWNTVPKEGETIEGTLTKTPWKSNPEKFNWSIKKPGGGGFGGRYNGPTAEQYARGQALIIAAITKLAAALTAPEDPLPPIAPPTMGDLEKSEKYILG